mgnify:CR=1 FL=1
MTKTIALGFDYGLKRIGLAVGQNITQTASPLETLVVCDGQIDWVYCDQVVAAWRPTVLVVGWPVAELETDQTLAKEVRLFSQQLAQRYQLPVERVDERFTTREARLYLQQKQGKSVNHLKVDGIAACLIVESYLRG